MPLNNNKKKANLMNEQTCQQQFSKFSQNYTLRSGRTVKIDSHQIKILLENN